jgi:predicted component of type VI protein secretion system
MGIQLEITSENKDLLGDDSTRLFRQEGGTIGRALENDWILPDPERFISGRHATIDHQSGAYYLADTSSNGVYVNDEDEPLGKGNPRRLFNGDRLRMGSFEFLVQLDEGEGLEMPPPPRPTVVPDHIEQLVQEDIMRSSLLLLDEEEITGDEEFQAALFGGPANAKTNGKSKPETAIAAEPNPLMTPDDPEGVSADELVDAFLQGTGISRNDIHPSVDPVELMSNAGQVLRELICGINDLLLCRTNVKSMFRLDQTTVLPRHNNPLKLSANSTDAIKQLLVGKEGEYLGPLDSVTEVCQDLRFHHDAVLAGMTGALKNFIEHFDPDELQDRFDKTLNRKPLFDALNKIKYWGLYCDLFPIVTQQGAGDLPLQFGEEFVRSYEQSIAEYKRIERGDGGALKSTVVMDRSNDLKVSAETEELVDQVDHNAEW